MKQRCSFFTPSPASAKFVSIRLPCSPGISRFASQKGGVLLKFCGNSASAKQIVPVFRALMFSADELLNDSAEQRQSAFLKAVVLVDE